MRARWTMQRIAHRHRRSISTATTVSAVVVERPSGRKESRSLGAFDESLSTVYTTIPLGLSGPLCRVGGTLGGPD